MKTKTKFPTMWTDCSNSRHFEFSERVRRVQNLTILAGGIHGNGWMDPVESLREMKARGWYAYIPERDWQRAFAVARGVNREFLKLPRTEESLRLEAMVKVCRALTGE